MFEVFYWSPVGNFVLLALYTTNAPHPLPALANACSCQTEGLRKTKYNNDRLNIFNIGISFDCQGVNDKSSARCKIPFIYFQTALEFATAHSKSKPKIVSSSSLHAI